MQGIHHVIHIILLMPLSSERRTSQPYWVYRIQTRFLWTPHQCVTHYYSTDPPQLC